MGMTYEFSYADASKLLEAKDEDGIFDAIDYDTEIAPELDREDFISSLLDNLNPELMSEKEKTIFGGKMHLLFSCDVSIVSRAMLERAINILAELDKKVFSMPYDKELIGDNYYCAGVIDRTINDMSKYGYVEDFPADDYFKNYSFYGPSKEFVDIVKTVFGVYDMREYHYAYPWHCNEDDGDSIGSYGVQFVLRTVLKKTKDMGEDKVLLLRRF